MKQLIWTFGLAAALTLAPGAAGTAAAQEGTTATAHRDLDARIHQRLKADRSLRDYDIDVSVTGRVATLSGTVATRQEKTHAGRLAHVNGITRVENDITVDRSAVRGTSGRFENGAKDVGRTGEHAAAKTGEVVTDGWITSRIHERFVGVDLLKDSNIDVDTNNHVVTLKGSVLSQAGRRKAVEIAKGTEGVHDVVDHLTVGRK
jgi:hyperosmotically inducible protein